MPGPTGRPPDSNGRRLAGSPLYLDMTLWSVVLFDRGGMFEACLAGLRERMRALGFAEGAVQRGRLLGLQA
jgi:hypothetical protein